MNCPEDLEIVRQLGFNLGNPDFSTQHHGDQIVKTLEVFNPVKSALACEVISAQESDATARDRLLYVSSTALLWAFADRQEIPDLDENNRLIYAILTAELLTAYQEGIKQVNGVGQADEFKMSLLYKRIMLERKHKKRLVSQRETYKRSTRDVTDRRVVQYINIVASKSTGRKATFGHTIR